MNPKKLYVWLGTAAAAAGLGHATREIGMSRAEIQRPTKGILIAAAAVAIAIEYIEYGLERKFLAKKK